MSGITREELSRSLLNYIDSSGLSEEQVRAILLEVVGAAPGQLDTLEELAAALGNDQNFAATVMAKIADVKESVSSLSGKLDTTNAILTSDNNRIGILERDSGTISQLQTVDKSNLVNAINELFQNANNGKTIIANAIGSPLLISDSFTTMGSKIDVLEDTFKTSLNAKGVTTTPTDEYIDLIGKITLIPSKKSASGVDPFTLGSNMNSGHNKWYSFVVNTNLNFTPSKIFMCFNEFHISGSHKVSNNFPVSSVYNYDATTAAYGDCYYNSSSRNIKIYITNVTQSSFTINAIRNDGYPIMLGGIKWEACE